MTDAEIKQMIESQQQQMQAMQNQLKTLQNSIAVLQAESAMKAAGKSPQLPLEFTSQFGEDRFAWTLLGRQLNGFYIEAGAFDGYHLSVTYALEAMGWKGLLVEAIPARYRQCLLRRPNSRVVNAVLSPYGVVGMAEFWVHADPVFSFSVTAERAQLPMNREGSSVKIPRATLDDLLADHHGPIDLVLLDVEGDEVNALNGFDLAKFRPRVLIIEDNTNGENPALRSHMAKHPYTLAARMAINDVYIRSDETQLLETVNAIAAKGF